MTDTLRIRYQKNDGTQLIDLVHGAIVSGISNELQS